jgi:hypothetical protein
MDKWAPTIVTVVVMLLGWAFTWGTLTQALKNTAEKTDKNGSDLSKHKDEIWPRVTDLEADVAVLNDRSGVTNPHSRPRGHVH